MSDIRFEKVNKSFGENKVLDDLSIVFEEGKTTVLMGQSGIGKTTILNLIMRLMKPDSGTITGVPVKIACVFQEDRLCEQFSAMANVRIVVNSVNERTLSDFQVNNVDSDKNIQAASGINEQPALNRKSIASNASISEHIMECFKDLELTKEDVTEKKVVNLSGGMKRRVSIARALMSDYELLVLDEPFKGLDIDTRSKVADTILKYNNGRTIIMVSHDKSEAELLKAEVFNINNNS
ncbi:MAG: ATP-binding cassette domain-containing protein [Eubacteriales bacterium]|nr:ATP-binding cassette domain-containing protein [Eubacteriales bacterium]